jgi:hypothetical protein
MVDELLRLATEQGVNKVKVFQDAVDAGCVEAIRMGHTDIAESLTRALDSSKLNEALREAVKRGNKALVEDLLEKVGFTYFLLVGCQIIAKWFLC